MRLFSPPAARVSLERLTYYAFVPFIDFPHRRYNLAGFVSIKRRFGRSIAVAIRVAINGFGRIGRLTFRIMMARGFPLSM